jgi:hypothetical protein
VDNVASILAIPSVVEDIDGREVTISTEARAELLRRAQQGKVRAIEAAGLWTLQSGALLRPVADFARAFDAGKGSAV